MSRSLASVLKTDSLKPLAQILRSKGRKGDTVLAHITPKEAAKLKREGGSGSINPDTGLPEFFGDEYGGGFDFGFSPQTYEPVGSSIIYDQPAGPYSPQTYEPPVGSAMIYDQPAGPFLADAMYGPSSFEAPVNTNIFGAPGAGGGSSPGTYYNYYGGTPAPGTFGQTAFMTNATAGTPYTGVPVGGDATSIANIAAGGGAGGQPTSIDAPGVSTKAADTSEKELFGDLISNKNALGLGILGAGGLMGYMNQQKAADQAKKAAAQIQAAYGAAAQQQKDLASPLIGPGYTQLSQALQGSLSPANQQAMQAAQARVAQASARSGGVGAVQSAVQEEAFRQQLLAQQQQQALALLAPGNAMIQAAINAQLQGTTQGLSTRLGLEQQANNAAMGLYAALGSAVGGGLMKGA